MFCRRLIVWILSCALFLTGCNSPVYNQTEGNVADVTQRSQEALQKSDDLAKPVPPLLVKQGLYVDQTPVNLAKDPAWLKNRIILRGDQLPFSYYSRTIVSGSGKNVLTHYQVGLDEAAMVSINYAGTVKGALDLLAAKTGYVYTVNGDDVYWQAFVTKTFDIAFMPGSSNYLMGKSDTGGGSSASTSSSSSSSSSTSGTTVTAIVDDSSASQYSSLKGTLSVWKDLEATIAQLLSPQGKVIVSESTTSVTVRDRPTNVALVTQYIKNLNRNLSKQVLVKVQVLDILLNNDYNYGINWTAVKRTMQGNNFFLNANYGTPVSITPLVQTSNFTDPSGAAGLPQVGFENIAGSTGVTALISALTQQGKVSVVTEPRVVCLNNQVSVVRIVNQVGYLASVQNTTVAGTGGTGNTVTSQITPGTLVTGLTLYILPKIMGKRVYLQVNADLSNSQGITQISSATGGSSGTATPIIQVPSVAQKQFNQRSMINSGDTLIISGFKQVTNQTGAMQLFNSQDLGGKASTQRNNETIVLITPIILPGYA